MMVSRDVREGDTSERDGWPPVTAPAYTAGSRGVLAREWRSRHPVAAPAHHVE
jgi:hypothetical protein